MDAAVEEFMSTASDEDINNYNISIEMLKRSEEEQWEMMEDLYVSMTTAVVKAIDNLEARNSKGSNTQSSTRLQKDLAAPTPFQQMAQEEAKRREENILQARRMRTEQARAKLVGRFGIVDLLSDRKIRKAKAKDIIAWHRRATDARRSRGVDDEFEFVSGRQVFVVMDEITLPSDLVGDHTTAFIVPEDVPNPIRQDRYPIVYFMKDGSCTGPVSLCK